MTKIVIDDATLEDYKKSAQKWNNSLLELPIAQANDVLKYMTGVYGLRGEMQFGSIDAESEFGPYDPDRVNSTNVNINYRKLTTYLGSVIEKFHPNDYAGYVMGYNSPTRGDGQKTAKPSLIVLSQLAKARGAALADAIFNGKRNETGTKTKDLFDGFNTIADKEITAGKISTANKNLYQLTEDITKVNAADLAKQFVFKMNPYLRRTPSFLFCSQDFADKYNEAYLSTHSGLIWNKQYNQVVVEGSNGNVTIVPLPELENTNKFYITPKSNLLWGTDNRSDESAIVVDRFESFRLTLSSTIYFGVQFHSIDPRKLLVVKLKASETA